ncbi:MAG: hypothetical protein L0Z55_03480 [Planctomycetes bacterium]|nr:hypothetical protein [Planctomycetota bacterium]
MRSLMFLSASICLLAGCAGASPGARPPATPDEGAAAPFACTIRSEPVCELGKAPVIAVEVANLTGREIYLVGSLDGSDLKWRYPHCYFEVTGPDGKAPENDMGRCGNMNALRQEDFVRVAAGASFDPYRKIDGYGFFAASQLSEAAFAVPGDYRVRFVYSTAGENFKDWFGWGNSDEEAKAKDLRGLFDMIPKATAISNEITITVRRSQP